MHSPVLNEGNKYCLCPVRCSVQLLSILSVLLNIRQKWGESSQKCETHKFCQFVPQGMYLPE